MREVRTPRRQARNQGDAGGPSPF